MTDIRKYFVVFDPVREEQPALERAQRAAVESGAQVHLYCCIYEDTSNFSDKPAEVKEALANQREVLDQTAAPLRALGIDVTTEVEWEKNWYNAVVRASIRHHADIVFKSSFRHSVGKRILNRTSDWTLIRECLCPVLLAKEECTHDRLRALAAVDLRVKKESYEKLNQSIIDFGRRLLDSERAEVHFVNAFEDFRSVPDRKALIDDIGIDKERVHIKIGTPEKVIVDQVKALDACMLIIGNSARSGLVALIHGNTVEKVLDKVDCDVLAVP